MNIQLSKLPNTFEPRPSHGWIWLVLMALIMIAVSIPATLALWLSSSSTVLMLIPLVICIPIAIAFLVIAFWFPAMRYELDQDRLVLRYGPILTYQIPLSKIRTIRRTNLGLTIWSTIRFPGIALFQVPYAGIGNVKMCATAALNNILLIETDKERYGLTPADEARFIAAVRAQMEA